MAVGTAISPNGSFTAAVGALPGQLVSRRLGPRQTGAAHLRRRASHKPRLRDERPKDIAEERLNCYFTKSYGIFSGRLRRKALLRFSPERARCVADETWHPQQRGRFENGHYILEIPYSDARELVLGILKHGPDIEVLRPKPLRTKVWEQLLRAASQYRRKP